MTMRVGIGWQCVVFKTTISVSTETPFFTPGRGSNPRLLISFFFPLPLLCGDKVEEKKEKQRKSQIMLNYRRIVKDLLTWGSMAHECYVTRELSQECRHISLPWIFHNIYESLWRQKSS